MPNRRNILLTAIAATVVSADADASNGVIHVINQVIMPD